MLTQRAIRDAKPRSQRYVIWDSVIKGLGLRVYPTGNRSFILSYRPGGGSTTKKTAKLGYPGQISLRDVRLLAGRELTAIRCGEPHILERRQLLREAPTVNDGITRFFSEYAPQRISLGLMKPKTFRNYQYEATNHVCPVIGNLPVPTVRRHHIERLLEKKSPHTRNRVRSFISTLFRLFEYWEWRPQHSNPCYGIPLASVHPRDRTLSDTEFTAFATAISAIEHKNPPAAAALRIACLTGLRIGEILAFEWNHIQFETGRILLPDTKTGPRSHDLPSPALAVLSTLPRNDQWVFSIQPGQLSYQTLRRHFLTCASLAQLENIRIHDLRRTLITRAASQGTPTHILRDLLGHKSAETADRYIRHTGAPVRQARQLIAIHVANLMQLPQEPPPSPE